MNRLAVEPCERSWVAEIDEWKRQARTCRSISSAGFAQSIQTYSGSKKEK